MIKAKQRNKPEIHEMHHVIPRMCGGGDNSDNLVALTPEEHYIAHLLLAKINGGRFWAAVQIMTVNSPNTKRTNKLYGWVRKNYIESLKGKKHSDETKIRMGNSRRGAKHSDETKLLLSKPKTAEHKEKIGAARRGIAMGPSKQLTCPHCEKTGPARGLTRWHFDNCKYNTSTLKD